jgi:hypothetical protein
VTVALPMYKVNEIVWLCLESLCNQKDVDFEWELLLCEEVHTEQFGHEGVQKFVRRLKKANCVNIQYIELKYHILLIDKWQILGEHAHESSEAFLLQAGDCHSPSLRLKNTFEAIVKNDFDWYDNTKGMFFSFISNKMIMYNYQGLTNLNMAFKTMYARRMPKSNLKKGIDGLLFNEFKAGKSQPFKKYEDEVLYSDSLDTQGHNNISITRETFFNDVRKPFEPTTFTVKNLELAPKIKEKLLKMSESYNK